MKKFLEFNGKPICFVSLDGTWWVALKPICEALKVNYNRQFQNLKKDKILSQLFAEQQMVGADNKLRKMVSLPERFIYGWLFSINSDSEALHNYKLKCYEILFNHFHGAITQRENLLRDKVKTHAEIKDLVRKLHDTPEYQQLQDLQAKEMRYGKSLKALDTNIIAEQTQILFNHEN